jgi:hypothetical protein
VRAGGVGWDDVRTVTFDEYATVPRDPERVNNFFLDAWEPPEGWTDPIEHSKFTYSTGSWQPFSVFSGDPAAPPPKPGTR